MLINTENRKRNGQFRGRERRQIKKNKQNINEMCNIDLITQTRSKPECSLRVSNSCFFYET